MFVNIPFVIDLPESQQLSWDMAKQIIQSQSNLAIFGITVLVGIAVLVMASSWIWNFFIHKHELKKVVEGLKSEITTWENELSKKLTETIKDEIVKIKKEIEDSIEAKMILFDADKARLFALTSQQSEIWESGALWWARAIPLYVKANAVHLVRISVDRLNLALKKCEKLENDHKKEIIKHLSFIPEILQDEKEQIEKKLNELPEKVTKQS
jgi:hypothetical protein